MKFKINMEIKFIISLLFAILVAIFAIQNSGSVEINFLFTKFTISQAVVILSSAIVGALIVLLLGLVKQIKQNMKIKQLSKEIEMLIEERDKLQVKVDEFDLANKDKEGKMEGNDESIESKNDNSISWTKLMNILDIKTRYFGVAF